jgi:hypothetical protein
VPNSDEGFSETGHHLSNELQGPWLPMLYHFPVISSYNSESKFLQTMLAGVVVGFVSPVSVSFL